MTQRFTRWRRSRSYGFPNGSVIVIDSDEDPDEVNSSRNINERVIIDKTEISSDEFKVWRHTPH